MFHGLRILGMLALVTIGLVSEKAASCCGSANPNFNLSTGHLDSSGLRGQIVVEAQVTDIRLVKPLHRPREMDIEILKTLQGTPPGRSVTLRTGGNSNALTFEDFKIGSKYRLAFSDSGTPDDPEYSMSLCAGAFTEIAGDTTR